METPARVLSISIVPLDVAKMLEKLVGRCPGQVCFKAMAARDIGARNLDSVFTYCLSKRWSLASEQMSKLRNLSRDRRMYSLLITSAGDHAVHFQRCDDTPAPLHSGTSGVSLTHLHRARLEEAALRSTYQRNVRSNYSRVAPTPAGTLP